MKNFVNHVQTSANPPSQSMLDEARLFLSQTRSACFASDGEEASAEPFCLESVRDTFVSKPGEWIMLDLPEQAGLQFLLHGTDRSDVERVVTVYRNLTLTVRAGGRPVLLPCMQGIVISDLAHLTDVLDTLRTAAPCSGITEYLLHPGKAPTSQAGRSPAQVLAHTHTTKCWNLLGDQAR